MELKKRLDFRKVFLALYFTFLIVYIVIGLRPAGATNYEISAELTIPSIGLVSDVTTLSLIEHSLETPDTIVGSFTNRPHKTLLIGHSSTVFKRLWQVQIGDEITYDNTAYHVISSAIYAKEDINMEQVLSAETTDTIVIMTCSGTDLGNGDATHRLIITAIAS